MSNRSCARTCADIMRFGEEFFDSLQPGCMLTGVHCQTDTDDCNPNPCNNGATCSDRVDDFACTCAPGYEGEPLTSTSVTHSNRFPPARMFKCNHCDRCFQVRLARRTRTSARRTRAITAPSVTTASTATRAHVPPAGQVRHACWSACETA